MADKQSIRRIVHEGLIWRVLGILSAAILVACYIQSVTAQSNGGSGRKTVLLQMSWKRGDSYYGPNFIHLESPCLGNPEEGCSCFQDFKITRSKEFADYIASFGNSNVPVKYHVDYDAEGQVVGAILESVGDWPEERFHINERSLGRSSRIVTRRPSMGKFRMPADCFPQSIK